MKVSNENAFITSSIYELGFNTIFETKDQTSTFKWCIKPYFIFLTYEVKNIKSHSYTQYIFSSGLQRNILIKVGMYAAFAKTNNLGAWIVYPCFVDKIPFHLLECCQCVTSTDFLCDGFITLPLLR